MSTHSHMLSNVPPRQRRARTMYRVGTLAACCVAYAASVQAQALDLFEEAVEESSAKPNESGEERANALYFSGRFAVNDADPVASVPPPEQQEAYPVDFGYFVTSLFDKGNRAAQRGEHSAAIQYYRALSKATPKGALALRGMCAEYRALGQHDLAQKACGLALTRNGVTIEDSVQYVQLVVTQAAELTPDQVADVESVIGHLAEQNAARATVEDLQCRLGARLLDPTRLAACTSELQRLNVPAEKISTYVWALAMLRGNTDEAKRQLALARSTGGLKSETLSSMAQATDGTNAAWYQSRAAKPLAALLLTAAALGTLAFASRRQHKRARH